MKFAKVFSLLCVLLLSFSLLFSCTPPEEDVTPGNGTVNSAPEGAIWHPGETLRVVVPDGSSVNVSKIVRALTSAGVKAELVTDSEAPQEHELVVGNCEREISKIAYKNFDALIIYEDYLSGYLIYSQNGNLAIAYDSGYGLGEATNYLVSLISKNKSLVSDNGIVAQSSFNKVEYIEQKRKEEQESYFKQIEAKLGVAATRHLRNLYSLYGTKTYIWLANLYDPIAGGFYYSNSGRNTIGYGPDLESTWQTLNHLQERGIFVDYNDDMALGLPEEIKADIIAFTQSLRKDDGYYYHPQWTSITLSRRSRDLRWANHILSALGAAPAASVSANGTASTVSLTAALRVKSCDAVSRIVPVASNEHLADFDTWKKYVDGLKLGEEGVDSWDIGNDLDAMKDEVKKAGDDYVNYLLDYLDDKQNESNGIWESEITYRSVSGLMKISSVYKTLGRNMSRFDTAFKSAMKMALEPELPEDAGIVYVYNPLVSMQNMILFTKPEHRYLMYSIVLQNADELISATAKKLSEYYKLDGSFSYKKLYSASSSQGSPVALPNSKEGDVNATTISCSTVDLLLDVLDVEAPPFYSSYDYEYFIDTLLDMKEIVKDNPFEYSKGAITFDDYDAEYGDEKYGVVMAPSNRVNTVVNGNYKYFQSAIVKNPAEDASGSDLVLKTNTYCYEPDATGKPQDTATGNFEHQFLISSETQGNTYVFDANIFVAKNENTYYYSPNLMQITFASSFGGNLFSLNIGKNSMGDSMCLQIKDNSEYKGLDGEANSNLANGISVNEWVNIRIECYKIYDENGTLSVKGKIFVNGEYFDETDAGYVKDGAYVDIVPNIVRVGYVRTNSGEFYFNDVVAESSTLSFVSQDVERGFGPATFEDFDYSSLKKGDVLYPDETVTNVYHDTLTYAITRDPKNAANKVMKVTKTKQADSSATLRTAVSLQENPEGGSYYVFESDVYMSGKTTLEFGLMNASNKPLSRIRLMAGSDGKIKIREYVSNIEGNVDIAEEVATTDEWFTFGIICNYDASEATPRVVITIYINGEPVVENLTAYNSENMADFNVSTFHIRYLAGGTTTAYFDNIIFQQADGYEYNGGHNISTENAEEVITFEGFDSLLGDAPEQPSPNLTNTGKGGTVFDVTLNPKDTSDKVLLVTDPAGTTGSFSQLGLTASDGDANRFVFESDIYIDSSATDVAKQSLGLAFTGAGDTKILAKIFVGLEESNGVKKVVLSPSSDVYSGSLDNTLIDVTADMWFKIKLVLSYGYGADGKIDKDSVILEVYVNDVLIGSLNTYNSARWEGSNAVGYTVGGVRLGYEKNTALKVYFDDISFAEKASETAEQTN
ncbi:MAG: hypothetical protein IJX92_07505 [Clostridia bacterium]|nr:hypothetical protein [Clostridia bacterium]